LACWRLRLKYNCGRKCSGEGCTCVHASRASSGNSQAEATYRKAWQHHGTGARARGAQCRQPAVGMKPCADHYHVRPSPAATGCWPQRSACATLTSSPPLPPVDGVTVSVVIHQQQHGGSPAWPCPFVDSWQDVNGAAHSSWRVTGQHRCLYHCVRRLQCVPAPSRVQSATHRRVPSAISNTAGSHHARGASSSAVGPCGRCHRRRDVRAPMGMGCMAAVASAEAAQPTSSIVSSAAMLGGG